MLKERLGGRKITSLVIALVGVLCVTLAPQIAAWAAEALGLWGATLVIAP
jgi:drug/metabolite transporter (DMT)-like permease